MFARWPHLHRPDPSPSVGPAKGPGQPGGLPGGGVTPGARAPGPVFGLNPPRPAWPYAFSGSCNLGHFLSWTRMVQSTAMMWRIVFRSDAATCGPQAAPTQLGPCPPDADLDRLAAAGRLHTAMALELSPGLMWATGRLGLRDLVNGLRSYQ